MARIQIELPEKFIFSTAVTVRVGDINYGGHLGNDAILALMQEARVQFYRELGFKDEVSFDGAVGQIIADAAIQYKAESFLGDELIIAIGVSGFTRVGFDMFYQVTEKQSRKEIARGKTGVVCFDYDRRKVAPIPLVLMDKLKMRLS
jgi:acyl-CoA thioester hydrolase